MLIVVQDIKNYLDFSILYEAESSFQGFSIDSKVKIGKEACQKRVLGVRELGMAGTGFSAMPLALTSQRVYSD